MCSAPKNLMKFALTPLLWAFLSWSYSAYSADLNAKAPDPVRQKLARAILSEGQEQQKLLGDLADSGSKVVADVLNAWARDGVYLYVAPDDSKVKVPVLLEDAEDANGKARAIRIEDGQFLKDPKGAELRFDSNDLNNADTDMRLRSAIQQTLDTLELSATDPDERWSAALKLGNSHKLRYVAVLQARLAKEPQARVRKALEEAMAPCS